MVSRIVPSLLSSFVPFAFPSSPIPSPLVPSLPCALWLTPLQAWDNCSETPFLYKTSAQTVVTYDDTYSLNSKAAYARDAGLAGVFAWSLDQDDGTSLVVSVVLGSFLFVA